MIPRNTEPSLFAHHLCVLVAGRFTSFRHDSLVPTALSMAAGNDLSKLDSEGTLDLIERHYLVIATPTHSVCLKGMNPPGMGVWLRVRDQHICLEIELV